MPDPLSVTASDDAAFEKLEERVLGLIAELRAAKRRETAAKEEVSALREAIIEKDRQVERLRAASGDSERGRDAIRKRIEALLVRVEKLDKAG